jgi:hypothetical protein
MVGILSCVAGPGLETLIVALPKAAQTLRQFPTEVRRQTPTLRLEQGHAPETFSPLWLFCRARFLIFLLVSIDRWRVQTTRTRSPRPLRPAPRMSARWRPRHQAADLIHYQFSQVLHRPPCRPTEHTQAQRLVGNTDKRLAYPYDHQYNDAQAVTHSGHLSLGLVIATVAAYVSFVKVPVSMRKELSGNVPLSNYSA